MSISQQLGLISRSPKSNYTPSLFKTHFLVRKSYIPASQAEPSPPIRSKLPSSSPDPDSPPPPPGPLSSCSCSSCSSAFLSCWFDLCSIHQARTSSSSSSAINPNVFFITFPTLDLLLNFQSTYKRAWKPTQRDTQTERENQNAWGIFVFLSVNLTSLLVFGGKKCQNFYYHKIEKEKKGFGYYYYLSDFFK